MPDAKYLTNTKMRAGWDPVMLAQWEADNALKLSKPTDPATGLPAAVAAINGPITDPGRPLRSFLLRFSPRAAGAHFVVTDSLRSCRSMSGRRVFGGEDACSCSATLCCADGTATDSEPSCTCMWGQPGSC
jgi:hypothetical protein